MDNAPQGAFSVTLDNGVVINFADGSLTGSSDPQPAQGEDPYVDGGSFNVSIASTSGGNYEDLDTSDTATITINDTIDTTTVTLDDVTVSEDGTITYTASVDNAPQGAFSVTLDNGVVINFLDGQTSGSSVAQPAQGEDVYIDAESFNVSIASTSGGNYEALDTSDTATVTINDTIDTSTVTLTATPSVNTGDTITYTATVSAMPLTTALVLTIVDENSVELGTITINPGETFGTLDVAAPETADTSYDASISAANGGEYEDLDISDTASTVVSETPVSSALLITNTNVNVQEVRVTIASEEGSNSTGVVEPTEVQGQEGSVLEFQDDVEFVAGETYTVTIEHVSGDPVILTDLSVSDQHGNVLDIFAGNAKLETGDTGSNTNFDGYIFNVTIGDNYASDPTDYSVSDPIGYEVLNGVLSLDTESNNSEFVLDFSELSLNGGENLFGDSVETIDISGKGTGEDNVVYLSATDVLELGDVGDNIINLIGDVDDVVNLVDQDGAGAGTWTQTASDATTTTYTYSDGVTDYATVVVENDLTTVLNTNSLDNS
ncbi:T1SS secreted agglutinin RTX [Marinobacterium lacunae]|uniref:T1SS secreted agglutinin RTX n=1 Tax=Marinobacterium lacunae TaxID=1232683 RepID=A0A081FWT1_9GAMM|nr:T1SS secreted agglutinin RTX [Marinobacterium lacunae]